MTNEEQQLVNCMITGMLELHFHTKQELALALDVRADMLDHPTSIEILDCLLHYCVRHDLPMEPLFKR